MVPTDLSFETDAFFSGGAGMFIQYEDVVKPVGLYVIVKMLLSDQSYGLPLNILSEMTNLSLVEWYVNRRYRNPLQCLDFLHRLDPNELNGLYEEILNNDPSIYKIGTPLNVVRMMSVYQQQHMTFPLFIYHPKDSPAIRADCATLFGGVNLQFAFGDLKDVLKSQKQNFTYIFSDIELVKRSAELLKGTCSHILLTSDYRYNTTGCVAKPKYDLMDLSRANPYVRLGTTNAINRVELAKALAKLYK